MIIIIKWREETNQSALVIKSIVRPSWCNMKREKIKEAQGIIKSQVYIKAVYLRSYG